MDVSAYSWPVGKGMDWERYAKNIIRKVLGVNNRETIQSQSPEWCYYFLFPNPGTLVSF
jgi:hypothetical protein